MKHTQRSHGPGAHLGARAMEAADRLVQKSSHAALLSTCRWINAEGTNDEQEARRMMEVAEEKLAAAVERRDRLRRGAMTGHELLQLVHEAQRAQTP